MIYFSRYLVQMLTQALHSLPAHDIIQATPDFNIFSALHGVESLLDAEDSFGSPWLYLTLNKSFN